MWVYGREGNETYLALVGPLRALTTRLPHFMLAAVSFALTALLGAYAAACRLLSLPLGGYMRQVVSRLDWSKRYLTIYDQLNPAYARYYREPEAVDLLAAAGFSDVRIYHRHGYSWAVTGTRPADQGDQ